MLALSFRQNSPVTGRIDSVSGILVTNIEIKARYRKNRRTRSVLKKIDASFKATKKQIDTYFQVEVGMLKIREEDGSTPQLIQYVRSNGEGPVSSHYEIEHLKDPVSVMNRLRREHGFRGVVRKTREIWMWKNVRIHFDRVYRLGEFIEFEAVMEEGRVFSEEVEKVQSLMRTFGLTGKELIFQSYIDFFA